jgi:ABC-type spermidine/putrescine transport system permease subunit I
MAARSIDLDSIKPGRRTVILSQTVGEAFFVFPVILLLADAFDKLRAGGAKPHGDFVLTIFVRVFSLPQYDNSAILTVEIAVVFSLVAALLGYPLACKIAKVESAAWNTCLMILVLASMQRDRVITLYGVLLGAIGASIGLGWLSNKLKPCGVACARGRVGGSERRLSPLRSSCV